METLELDLPTTAAADPAAVAAAIGAPSTGGAPIAKPKGGRPRGRKDAKPRKRAKGLPPVVDAPAAPHEPPRVSRASFAERVGVPAPGVSAATDPARVGELGDGIRTTAEVLFSVAASVWGEHWRLSADQAAALGASLAPIAARHCGPDQIAAAPYVSAVVIVAGIIVPRVRETRRSVAAARKVAVAETAAVAPAGAVAPAVGGLPAGMIDSGYPAHGAP